MSSSRCTRIPLEACNLLRVRRLQVGECRFVSQLGLSSPAKSLSPQSAVRAHQQRRYATSSTSNETKSKSAHLPESNPPQRSALPTASMEASSNSTASSTSKLLASQVDGNDSKQVQSSASAIERQTSLDQEQGQGPEPATPARPIPPNVLAAYRSPLKHPAPYGVPVASLQLRSYSVRSLEFFSDFALRAAWYLNLPARGPVPLPKRIERWTTPRSNFVHKKSQENFERITFRRVITLVDGEKSAVEVWLAVLRKWQFYGVGMKANVWEWEGLDLAVKMDERAQSLEADIADKLKLFGWATKEKNNDTKDDNKIRVEELIQAQGVKAPGVSGLELRDGVRRAKSEI